jgi:hypothetical protein
MTAKSILAEETEISENWKNIFVKTLENLKEKYEIVKN